MQNRFQRLISMTALILLSFAIGVSYAPAGEKRDMQGWGIDDPYNKLYDVREYEKIRASVVRVKRLCRCPACRRQPL
jgi:hypothetical protein